MTILDVKRDIVNKSYRNFYIFHGDEVYCMGEYIHRLSGDRDINYIDCLDDMVLDESLLLSIKRCYVMHCDASDVDCDVIKSVTNRSSNDITLIIVLNAVDKRTRLYKEFEDYFVCFDRMSEDTLITYVQNNLNLTDDNSRELIRVCENDLGRILLEIDKVKRLAEETKKDCNIVFCDAMNEGCIHIPYQDSLFKFIDSVLVHNMMYAFYYLECCLHRGENVLGIIGLLYSNFKNMLQVQFCTSKDVEKSTGLSSWQIKKIREKCGYYTEIQIKNVMKLCRYVEVLIKRGDMEESVAIPYILVNC